MTRDLHSPEFIRLQMASARRAAADLVALSWTIQDSYEALYDAAYSSIQIPTGAEANSLAPGKKRWTKSDPTADVAISGLHGWLRWHTRRVASQIRNVTKPLEVAESMLVEAGDKLAPEMREKLRRLEELERAEVEVREDRQESHG